jgi:hypothetical protein
MPSRSYAVRAARCIDEDAGQAESATFMLADAVRFADAPIVAGAFCLPKNRVVQFAAIWL